MSKPLPDPNASHSAGWFIRWICWITGTDPTILFVCPQRDRDQVVTVAVIQFAAFIWQTLVIALAAHVMLARPGSIRPELVAISVLLAAIIGLIDSYMIIRSSWFLHGIEELKRAGLVLPGSVAARFKNAFFVAVRICMASVSALLVGAVVSILVFEKDVASHLEAIFQSRNSRLIETATQQIDAATADLERSRMQLEAQLARDAESAGQAGFSLAGPEAERIQAAAAHVRSLETARGSAESDLRQAQTFAADELAGIRHDRRNSGVPGRGARRLAAEERRRQADERLRAVDRDLAVERKRLDELRQSAVTLARQQEQSAGPRLAGIETVRQQHVRELAALDKQLTARRAMRAAAIQEAVEHDPSFRARDDGLLARARALVAVAAEDPWTRSLIIALDLFFFVVELAAVIVKTTTFVPSAYACTLAKEECLRARQTSHEIAEYFNLLAKGRPAAVPDQAPAGGEQEGLSPGKGTSTLPGATLNGSVDASANGSAAPTPRRPRGRPPNQRTLPPAIEDPFDMRKPKADGGDELFGPAD